MWRRRASTSRSSEDSGVVAGAGGREGPLGLQVAVEKPEVVSAERVRLIRGLQDARLVAPVLALHVLPGLFALNNVAIGIDDGHGVPPRRTPMTTGTGMSRQGAPSNQFQMVLLTEGGQGLN